MSLREWAEKEVEIACKRENPDWDGKSFDYGCSCYQSALKAYKSLLEDEHSGMSFSLTRNILERLMRSLPLTPITDEDFNNCANIESDEELKHGGLASYKQCPRMSSLFRIESIDGTVKYHDVNRVECFTSGEYFGSHFGFVSNMIDEMYPIKMPLYPEPTPYKVFIEEFLVDPKNGDFDTVGIFYGITPSGERFEINRYFTEKDDEFVEIHQEDYDYLKEKAEARLKKEKEEQNNKENEQ